MLENKKAPERMEDDFFAELSSEELEKLSKAWRRLTASDLERMVDLAQED